MQKLETLDLGNICGGSLPELFERELQAVIANIADPNTDPKKKRSISVEFSFTPFKDRTGAQVELRVVSKLTGNEAVTSSVFIHKTADKTYALPRDARQQEFFPKGTAANTKPETTQ
jgi:hypothetical protein